MNELQKFLANQNRERGNDKVARIYDFFAECEQDDYRLMFNTGDFNDIAEDHLSTTVNQLVRDKVINQKQADAVRIRYMEVLDHGGC